MLFLTFQDEYIYISKHKFNLDGSTEMRARRFRFHIYKNSPRGIIIFPSDFMEELQKGFADLTPKADGAK